jgi:hypothetical protein
MDFRAFHLNLLKKGQPFAKRVWQLKCTCANKGSWETCPHDQRHITGDGNNTKGEASSDFAGDGLFQVKKGLT